MTTRFATQHEIDAAPVIPVILAPSAHRSDTMSNGPKQKLYASGDLKKDGNSTLRTIEFERRLVAIFWATGNPVPFLFRTSDGQFRSMDAGCLGHLFNRARPDVALVEQGGVIVAVSPSEHLLRRLAEIRQIVEATLL